MKNFHAEWKIFMQNEKLPQNSSFVPNAPVQKMLFTTDFSQKIKHWTVKNPQNF